MNTLLLGLLLAQPAVACPTVATGTPNALTYDVARTAIVHQNGRITFTVSVNPSGEAQDFALVLPVPALLAESDIAVLDNEVFARLEGTTGLLTMTDAGCMMAGSDGAASEGDEDGGSSGGSGSVTVEAEYLVGDYEIAILSATDSSGLFTWLDTNGYHLAEPTIPVLEDYIAEGMFFMTARVSSGAAVADGSALPPLQVAYDSELFTIPIRLAARNSPGQQDMLIYALTDRGESGGRVGVSNYPEFSIADKCIWGDPNTDSFLDFYNEKFQTAWEARGFAAWTTEWAGGPYDCSPCSGVTMTDEDLLALGFQGDPSGHFLTRLHLRYTPTTATQDLMLYASGLDETKVTSFADDNSSNRECIALCDTEPSDGTGDSTPEAGDPWTPRDDPASTTTDESESKSRGCAVASSGMALGMGWGLVALLTRRRKLASR